MTREHMTQRCRTKIRLFASRFMGACSRFTRTIMQQKIRPLVSSHQDRNRNKEKLSSFVDYSK